MAKPKDLGHLAHIVAYDAENHITVPAGITMHTNQLVASQAYVDAALGSYALSSALGSYVPTSRTITINGTTFDLSANRTFTIAAGLSSFNTRTGDVTLTSSDVTTALGFTPVTNARTITINGTTFDLSADRSYTVSAGTTLNGTGFVKASGTTITYDNSTYLTGITSTLVTNALGFTPYNATNPSGYITGITSANVTTALGFTPYNATNPSGFITSSGSITGNAATVTNGVYTNAGQNNLSGILNFGSSGAVPYNSPTGTSNGISFGGVESSSLRTYGIFTEQENIGGNYSKLTINYHTGIRIGAMTSYGGTRFYNNFAGGSGGGSEIFSVGNGDSDVRVANTLHAAGSVRAPIFYDSNDTAYYLNPAGGSRLRNLYVGDSGDDWSDPGGWGTQIRFSNGPHVRFVLHARTPGIEAGMYVHTPGEVYIGSYTGHNVSLMFGGSRRMFITSGYVYTDVYLEAAGSLRAPIFYDSNDTGYYADFNTTSNTGIRLRGGILMGPNPTWGAYLQVGGNGNETDYAIVVATDGNLHMDSQVNKAMYLNYYHNGTIWLNGSTYSISSNGSYYNGTSGASNALTVNATANNIYNSGWFRNYGDSGLYNQDYGCHIARNSQSSHGSWSVWGYTKAGYVGMNLQDPQGYNNNLMYEQGRGGCYQENGGGWHYYYDRPNDCLGLSGSETYDWVRACTNGKHRITNDTWCDATSWAYTFSNISDGRLKENIVTVDSALDKVLQLRGVYYNWIIDTENKKHIGLIAQETAAVCPEVVNYHDETDTYSVNYSELSGLFVESTKELNQKLMDANARIELLETKLNQLLNA
jgi:hypothetical protein